MAKAAVQSTISVGSAVAEVVNIGGPNISVDMIDVTHLTSTDSWREFLAGLVDGGEVTMDCNLTTANAAAMFAKLGAASASACTITLAGTSGTLTFNAHVSGISVSTQVADKIGMTVTLKTTGKVTYT